MTIKLIKNNIKPINFKLLLISLFLSISAFSQSIKDVNINEIQVYNTDSNNSEETIPRSEVFRQADPFGIVLTITNIAVVTIALTLLFFVFKCMGSYHLNKAKKKGVLTNDELAAIAIALYKYVADQHDSEKLQLTIDMTSKVYSPWSSKIYGLRQIPNKK